MNHATPSTGDMFAEAVHTTLRALPIAGLPLTLASDIAYARTSNLLWLHLSEWLLLAAAIGTALSLLVTAVDRLLRRIRPTWPAILMGMVVFALILLNNLVHTRDGWTAVMPQGLALSAASVAALFVTAWLGRKGYRHA